MESPPQALGGAATTLAILGLLAAWAWPAVGTVHRRLRALAAMAGAVGVLASLAAALLGSPAALLLPLPEGMQATSCRPAQPCLRVPVAGRHAFDVYRDLGDDPLKPRHTLLAHRDDDGDSQLLMGVQPLRTGTPSGSPGNPVQLTALQPLPDGAGVLVSARTQQLPRIFLPAPGPFSAANYYVFLHLTAAGLRAQGLQDFTMAPLRHHQDSVALGLSSPLASSP